MRGDSILITGVWSCLPCCGDLRGWICAELHLSAEEGRSSPAGGQGVSLGRGDACCLPMSCNCIPVTGRILPNNSLERTGLSVRNAGVVEPAVEVPPGVGGPEPPRRSARGRWAADRKNVV